jgi:hypothetical protein
MKAGRDLEADKGLDRSFDAEEETIARPSPMRMAPTTLKRPPPAVGPTARTLPGVRPAVADAGTVNAIVGSPVAMMPDVRGWDPPMYSPYPTPAPVNVPNPVAMIGGPVVAPPSPYPAVNPYSAAEPGQPFAMNPGYSPNIRSGPPTGRDRADASTGESERWRTAALVLGAITMAVLAFAVTRSCMHQDPQRPPLVLPTSMPAATSAPASTPAP